MTPEATMIRRWIKRIVAWWNGGDCDMLVLTTPELWERFGHRYTLNTGKDIKRTYIEDAIVGDDCAAGEFGDADATVTREELDELMEARRR